MPISDKTRKMLWGRSGNRCTICKCELVVAATSLDDESVIGEECHIISRRPSGPRHNSDYGEDQFDQYENLILLCRIHHKMIDDQNLTYKVSILTELKSDHEIWVSKSLANQFQFELPKFRRKKSDTLEPLTQLRSGSDVMKVVAGACAGSFDHAELNSEQEVNAVTRFFEEVHGLRDVDMGDGLADRVRLVYELTNTLAELEDLGLLAFGLRDDQVLQDGSGKTAEWPVSVIRVVRKGGKAIEGIDH